MSVSSVDKEFDTLTITLVADFDAAMERVWQLWAEPAAAGALVGTAELPGDRGAARAGARR